jgi:hypothetical protein
VFRQSGLRYYFFLSEGRPPEAPHIHIKGGGRDAKVWLEPEISLADSYGFNPRELSNILMVVAENHDLILGMASPFRQPASALTTTPCGLS